MNGLSFFLLLGRPNEYVTHGVDLSIEAGQYERVRVHLRDNRWAMYDFPSPSNLGTVPECGFDLFAIPDD